jgi:hypothetical protein
MTLSDEDKRRIEEEEQFRAEARRKAELAVQRSETRPKPQTAGTGGGCLKEIMIILVGFGVFLIIIALAGSSGTGAPSATGNASLCSLADGLPSRVKVAYEQGIEAALIASATAKFSDYRGRVETSQGTTCVWSVGAQVSSVNAFGTRTTKFLEATVGCDDTKKVCVPVFATR